MSNLKEDAAAGIIELTSPREGEIEAVLVFPPGLAVFGGHFPGHPLVPGILELEMVRAVMERFWPGSPLRINSIDKAKFVREIKPGERIRLSAAFSPSGENKGLRVKAHLWVEGEKAAQIQLTVQKDG
jgi:3-hydroxyacyl-[acyl-carrier-protein] dehydratase